MNELTVLFRDVRASGLQDLVVNDMILTNRMPESGQFVALWTYEGRPWSATLKYENGILLEWQQQELDIGRTDGVWIEFWMPDTMAVGDLIFMIKHNNGESS